MLSAPIRRLCDPTDPLQKLVNKEFTRLTGNPPEEAKAADADNDGDAGSGGEGGKKKKTPNLSRMLKSRLQKLVDKTDDECAPSSISTLHAYANLGPLVDALSLLNSWNFQARNCGLVTTRSSRDLNVSRTYLYVFPVTDIRPYLTLWPQKKLKRKEYHMSAEFSKDVQLVFSNAVEFNSEGSQIHEDAQTLKVCSSHTVVSFCETERRVVVLLPPAHV